MIPERWKQKPVGKYLKILSGFPFKSEFFTSVDPGGLPVIRIRDLLDSKSETYYCGEYDPTYLIVQDDLLVGMDGEFHIVRWKGIESLLNQRICKIASNDNTVLDTHFIYYFLQPQLLQMQHDIAATTVKHLSTKHLKSIVAPLPPLTEQKQIAGVLGGLDAAIEATKTVIEQTKKVKQGLLQTLLTRGIGHTKFKPSTLGKIPESWQIRAFGNLCALAKRKYNPKTALKDARCVELEHVEQATGNLIGEASANGLNSIKSVFKAGDVLFGKLRPYLRKYYFAQFDGVCTTEIWVFNPTAEILGKYLYLLVQSNYFIKAANVSSGTKMPRAEWSLVSQLEIALPPLPEQKAIAEIFDGIDNQLTTETVKLASLQQLKKGLMHDLLTGKVRVPVENPVLQIASNTAKISATQKTVHPAFKRAVLAAEITHQLYQNPKFGSVKQEKIIDLCERHLDLDAELDRTAYRQAAGPYDNKAKRSIEINFKSHKWFDVQRLKGKGVKYLPLENCGQHKSYFDRYFGNISTGIQSVINLLKDMKTEQCEIVATLYASWNDFLLKGQTPDDETIVNDVLNNWHDKKLQISKDRWQEALPWMRRNNLVPHGSGRVTKSTKI